MNIEKFIIENDFVSSDQIAEIRNPFNDKVVSKAYRSDKNHTNTSLNYLSEIFQKYRESPVYLRSELLERISDKISDKSEYLSQLVTLETGKPIKFSRIETERAVLTFKLGSEEAKRIDGEVINLDLMKDSENVTGIIKRFPVGVLLAITPWNFPLNLISNKPSPALSEGMGGLVTPASASLCCGIEIVKIIKECSDEMKLGYCPVNVITSSGKDTEEFVSDKRVKMVSFTGSAEVGWNLRSKVSRQKISLELG